MANSNKDFKIQMQMFPWYIFATRIGSSHESQFGTPELGTLSQLESTVSSIVNTFYLVFLRKLNLLFMTEL